MVFKAHFFYVFSTHFKPIYSLFLLRKKAYCGRHLQGDAKFFQVKLNYRLYLVF